VAYSHLRAFANAHTRFHAKDANETREEAQQRKGTLLSDAWRSLCSYARLAQQVSRW
jgi:hypothetical protein